MISIDRIVRDALSSGYLTRDAEEQLRHLRGSLRDRVQLKAFFQLQQAAMEGRIQQESREESIAYRTC